MVKKIVAALLVFLMVLSALAALAEQTAPALTRIGVTAFSIAIPEGYVNTPDVPDEDQIGYYCKDENSIDFDVYAWVKGEETEAALEEEAAALAELYGSSAAPVEINGISGMLYISYEEMIGETWTVYNYLFEDEYSFIEICFWTDGSEEEIASAEAIIGTLVMG
ncbi:MAG: hypothetical protein Q4A66_12005 [Eubacteriales bacterium]|nr:hypothetical protein [Eubacteriales bacterium]